MNLNEYQEQAKRTLSNGQTFQENITMCALGLTGESGEFADFVKKWRYHGHPLMTNDVIKELGDILWYVAATATVLGIDLNEIATVNLRKLRERYPDGFDSERSINRT